MRLIRLMGLAVVAIVSLGIATTASAAPPEFGRCVAAIGKTGAYKGTSCTAPAGGKGAYNWLPGPGPAPAFSGSGEKVGLETPGKLKLICGAATFDGAYSGPKTVLVTLDLIGCENAATKQKCQTTLVKEGEIEAELEGEIGFISGGAKPVVGLDLKPPASSSSSNVTTFQCGKAGEVPSVNAVVEGSVIGPIKPINHMVEEFKLTYAETNGVQAVRQFEGGAQDTLVAKLLSGGQTKTEEIALRAGILMTNDERMEIKAK
jgi:hypothetical protein